MANNPIDRLLGLWRSLERRPGGKTLFSFLLGRAVPYTGSIRARVLELAPGHARASIRDRRRLRNHLRSVHALALANLGELTTGLAFNAAMPADARGIPVRITTEYLKKARGTITARCRCEPPESSVERDYEVTAELADGSGDLVARVIATWRVGPRPAPSAPSSG